MKRLAIIFFTFIFALFLIVHHADAAAQPALTNATSHVATSVKDNVLGVIGNGALLFVIGFFVALSIAMFFPQWMGEKISKG